MEKISVELERRNHRYDILVEAALCDDWRDAVDRRMRADRYIVLTDAQLAPRIGMPAAGTAEGKWNHLRVEPGEPNKTFAQYGDLCEKALAMGLDRKSVTVAIGGGVTGDISGFVASTLMRGVRLVMIPTTLLAMTDSSVGGKNGVNTAGGKNLVGTFHQPDLVLIDPTFLDTLPLREYLAGLAEVVKTAILDSREFFFELDGSAIRLLSRDHERLSGTIARCCRVKADIVVADEREGGKRALLNLGHTFAHALETLAGYDGRVVHGEAVAVGTALAAEFAVKKGLLDPQIAADIRGLLERLDLPIRIGQLAQNCDAPADWDALLRSPALPAALLADKKNAGGTVTLVLPHGIGDCRVVKGNDAAEVAEFMQKH